MTGWYTERMPGRSAKAVIFPAVTLLALLLVAAVPGVALLAGLVLMALGHVVGRTQRTVLAARSLPPS